MPWIPSPEKVKFLSSKTTFLLSLMFLLNFSIPFVQKQFHIGFHNGWKCRLGITIDVTYRMNSIQKRGGVELLLVSADYSQIEFNCDYLLISSKDSIRHSFQYVVLNLSLNKPLIKGAFFFCSEPLRDHFSFMQYFIWMNFESIHSTSKTLKTQCLKITQNVSFEFFNIGIFHQFCTFESDLSGNTVWPPA